MRQQQHTGITPPGNYWHLCTGESLPPFPFAGVPVGGLRHLFCMPVGSSLFHYQHSFSQPGLPGWWVGWLEQYGHLLYIPHSGQLRLGATCCIYIYTCDPDRTWCHYNITPNASSVGTTSRPQPCAADSKRHAMEWAALSPTPEHSSHLSWEDQV